MKFNQILSILFVLLFSPFGFSAVTGGGVLPYFGTPDSDGHIKGVRVNPGWGMHKTVYGFDFGLVGNSTTKEFIGMGFAGIFNTTDGKAIITGLQMAGVLNRNGGKTHIAGIQYAIGANSSPGDVSVYGIQASLFANTGNNNIYGFQVGIYNEAEVVYGLQIGVVNKAKNLHGIQIGLLNYHEKGLLPYMPLINIGF